jgi:general secretion pathway protein F
MTIVLISISTFVQHYGLSLLLLCVGMIFFVRRALKKNGALRAKAHHIILHLPIIGRALQTSDTARFSRTLSILSAAGVPILDAMRIAAQLITAIPIREAVGHAVNHIREGAAVHLALKQTGYFSPMSIHMIASGEASGQLEPMLERVAIHQESDVSRLIEVALALFEPAVILIMGAIVLFIVLAVLLPIFNLNDFTG